MASTFPGAIDNFTDPLSNSSLASPSHAGQHSDLNDAVEKIETYMGLVKVIPTAATNGTVGATGTVTIGNTVSSVDVRGCWSSLYDGYRVVMNGITMSGPGYGTFIQAQMLSGTTPNTAALYAYGFVKVDQGSGTVDGDRSPGAIAMQISRGNGGVFGITFDILNPYAAQFTIFSGMTMTHSYNGYGGAGGGCHAVASSYDGIRFFPSSGTFTGGTIRVYGYRN